MNQKLVSFNKIPKILDKKDYKTWIKLKLLDSHYERLQKFFKFSLSLEKVNFSFLHKRNSKSKIKKITRTVY